MFVNTAMELQQNYSREIEYIATPVGDGWRGHAVIRTGAFMMKIVLSTSLTWHEAASAITEAQELVAALKQELEKFEWEMVNAYGHRVKKQ